METSYEEASKDPCMFRGWVLLDKGTHKVKPQHVGYDGPLCGHDRVRYFDVGVWAEERYKCCIRFLECAICTMPIRVGLGVDRTGYGGLWTGLQPFRFNETIKRKHKKDPKSLAKELDALKKKVEHDNLVASENKRKLEQIESEMKRYGHNL